MFFYMPLCLSQYLHVSFFMSSLFPLSPFLSPFSHDRNPSMSPAETLSSLAAASAYVTQLACVFEMLVFSRYPSFFFFDVLCVISPCLSCFYLLYTCVSFAIFLILMPICITAVSCSVRPLRLTASLPRYPPSTHLLSVLIFVLSCSPPLLLSSLSHSLLFPFFLSFSLFCRSQAHTFFSRLRWESQNASEEKGVEVECHLYIVFTLPLVMMWESTVWREENMW